MHNIYKFSLNYFVFQFKFTFRFKKYTKSRQTIFKQKFIHKIQYCTHTILQHVPLNTTFAIHLLTKLQLLLTILRKISNVVIKKSLKTTTTTARFSKNELFLIWERVISQNVTSFKSCFIVRNTFVFEQFRKKPHKERMKSVFKEKKKLCIRLLFLFFLQLKNKIFESIHKSRQPWHSVI